MTLPGGLSVTTSTRSRNDLFINKKSFIDPLWTGRLSMVLLRSIRLSQSYVKMLKSSSVFETEHNTQPLQFLNLCYKVLHINRQEDYIFPSLNRNREGSTVWRFKKQKQKQKNCSHVRRRCFRAAPPLPCRDRAFLKHTPRHPPHVDQRFTGALQQIQKRLRSLLDVLGIYVGSSVTTSGPQ